MKLRLSICCLILLLTIVSPLYAAPPIQNGTATLVLTNDSEETIRFVRLTSTTEPEANQQSFCQQLGALPGETRSFKVEPGQYNVRLEDCDGNTLLEKTNLTITNTYTLGFTEPGLCLALSQVGESFYDQAHYQKALKQFQQANECYHKAGNRSGEGESFRNIGEVYLAQGQYGEALDNLEQALTIFREVGDRNGEGNSLNIIGDVHLQSGNYDQALDYFRQSLVIRQENNNRCYGPEYLVIKCRTGWKKERQKRPSRVSFLLQRTNANRLSAKWSLKMRVNRVDH